MIAQGTGVAPLISMLRRIINMKLFDKYKILMLIGARDNKFELIYKDVLLNFFSQVNDNNLYLACSRNIENNEK